MTKKEVAEKYIEFLENGKIPELINLFTENGVVHSPIYGLMLAKDFYPKLNDDTNNSELKLDTIFEDEQSNKIALYFKYIWTLKSDKVVEFDVVDIIEFNAENKITDLKIIYDTVISRKLVQEINNK